MQTGGDQQTVQESIDTCANSTQTDNSVTQSNQAAEDHGPYEQQDSGNNDGDNSGNDSNGALAAEECQHVRQLGALELVVADAADNTSQDTNEGVAADLSESNLVDLGCDHTGSDGADSAGVQQSGDHQVRDHTSQAGSAVFVLSQANTNTDCEQDSHIVDQGSACLNQENTQNVCEAFGCTGSAHGSGSQGVTQTHQNTTDGQCSNRQHHSFAQLLQIFHHRKFPP